ncbi:HPF/RaiA family ribosome-associated protein [candidate division KSB1 bacterium]|nr:HPF/RaiA family ribosome-associated protein [candidate division KSB1 bacterium]
MPQVPLEVSYRNVQKTDEIEGLIHEKVEKLEQVCYYMTSCRVAVEKPQEHLRTGNPYRVRVEIRVPPGHDFVSKQEPGEGEMHDSIVTVLQNVFDSARRQLRKVVERQRGEVKKHPKQQTQAVVTKLFTDRGFGFLETIDGREIYFHKNSVLHNGFDRLDIGTGVRFVEHEGEKGPQASSVQIIEKPVI